MFLCMYAYTSNSINFDWYLIFHTYMCFDCAYYISIFLSTNFGYSKLDFFNDYYISIDYVSIGISNKLMHYFIWHLRVHDVSGSSENSV